MPLSIYSAWRAWSLGIGDGPNLPQFHEENQYTDADPEIWNQQPELAPALMPWLLFTGRHPDHVGWSVVPIAGWVFVGYLRGTGRQDYYAHARGWRKSDWEKGPAFDPGVWLGDQDGFDPIWKPPAQAPRTALPALIPRVRNWKDSLGREPVTAESLLATLYHAVESDSLAVWSVPANDFRDKGEVGDIVSFARTALPWHLKAKARIGVNPKYPGKLQQAGAHLLVLSEDDEPPHGAKVVLARDGQPIAGTPAPEKALSYAHSVVKRCSQYPEAVLRFSVIASERLPQYSVPEQLEAATTVAYNLALAGEGKEGTSDRLLRQFVYPESQRRAFALDWATLIAAEDWRRVSLDTLRSLALEEAPSEDSQALRQQVGTRLRDEKMSVEPALSAWWKPDYQHAIRLLDLQTTKEWALVSPKAARDLLRMLPVAEVATLLADAAHGPRFLHLTSGVNLPPEWASPDLTNAAGVAEIFQTILSKRDFGAAWRSWLDASVRVLARKPEELPPSLGARLADCPAPEVRADLPLLVAYGELYHRFESAEVAKILKRVMDAAKAGVDHEELVRRTLDGSSRFLRARFPIQEVLPGIADPPPDAVIRFLDERLTKRPVAEVSNLTEAGWWPAWRRRTRLGPEALRVLALAWLKAGPVNRLPEEWDRVIGDLGARLGRAEIREFSKASWVAGPDFYRVLEASTDLGTDIELARICKLAGSPFHLVAERSRHASDLPGGILQALSGSEPFALSFPQAQILADRCEGLDPTLQDRALELYVPAFAEAAGSNHPSAVDDVVRRRFWDAPAFCSLFAQWIYQEFNGRLKTLASGLESAIPPPSRAIEKIELRPEWLEAAKQLRIKRYRKLARFLDPTVRFERDCSEAARDLAQGRLGSQALSDLVGDAIRATAQGVHPLCALADTLDELDTSLQSQLEASGDETLRKLFTDQPGLLNCPQAYSGPLPALVLWMRVSSSQSLGGAACELLLRQRRIYPDSISQTWIQALVRAVNTATRRNGEAGPDDDPAIAMKRVTQVAKRVGDTQALTHLLHAETTDNLESEWEYA